MTKEEAKKEICKVFEPAFANYIITALEEGATVSDECEDAVSRKEVFKMIEQIQDAGGFIDYNTYSEAFDRVDNMSSVRPVSCIAKVTFNKEDMQKIVDEKVKELVLENAR